MTVKTIKSEEARSKMRDILDDVTAGREVVIERYNKPVGVIIPHALWQRFKKLQREEIARIRQEMDAGNYRTWDEVKTELQAEGILP
ncbi:MAG: type II toxin-antitoxin system Phd/YefM family antitoxin [Caldilinea sp. CFX5]|nr:type II toxin-antitoxin system Phd/YefM family antitoxin [Caldilinea sp. CFX5]